ncbi:glycoside hydrolase family 28 protein [Viridothelium virens]|uniref:endo-polygalacturonase n=1 Tax=Viridothelium virens TaxID=1048519 RepID=A0A6A6HNM4_VIRVR|nr:glycoside hydrolase family 28 protein [Viridothelium virens]
MIASRSIPVLALAALSIASPVVPAPEITAAPSPAEIQKRATSCTFSGSSGASLASVSQKSCSTIVLSNVAVPSGVTLNLSDLEDDTTVIFEGTTTWGYKEWAGPLMQIEGSHITIKGASGAVLNGNGAEWWDGEGGSGGKTKPKFFYAHDLTDSTISNLYIQNTPVQAISIDNANSLIVSGVTIDNRAGDTGGGKNTDGFDIGDSTGVTITGANVYNQDDCVAVNSGTSITFSGGVCSGGHGLSIGSVGGRSDNTVETVTFENSEVKSSSNGIRIKATEGDTGTIKGITYSGITLSGITGYGILIEQNYDGGDLKGTPTAGIPITDVTLSNISGSGGVQSSATNVEIVCASGACSSWTWNNVVVTGGKTSTNCQGVPSGASCSA